jgi:hypothetical protein
VRALAFLLASVVLALAACGGDDEAYRREKAAWIAGADAICARVNRQIEALGEPLTLPEIADYAAKVQRIAERQLGQLRNLEPPKRDEELVGEMLARVAEGIKLTGDVEQAARHGQTKLAFEAVDRIEVLTDEANTMARDYGLADCAGAT